jgi:hypothetical protein
MVALAAAVDAVVAGASGIALAVAAIVAVAVAVVAVAVTVARSRGSVRCGERERQGQAKRRSPSSYHDVLRVRPKKRDLSTSRVGESLGGLGRHSYEGVPARMAKRRF